MDQELRSIWKKETLEHLSGVRTDQGATDSIITELSDNDLSEMGIDKLVERKRLLTAFAATGSAQNEPGAAVEIQGGELRDGRKAADFAIGKFAVTMEEWRVVREWWWGLISLATTAHAVQSAKT